MHRSLANYDDEKERVPQRIPQESFGGSRNDDDFSFAMWLHIQGWSCQFQDLRNQKGTAHQQKEDARSASQRAVPSNILKVCTTVGISVLKPLCDKYKEIRRMQCQSGNIFAMCIRTKDMWCQSGNVYAMSIRQHLCDGFFVVMIIFNTTFDSWRKTRHLDPLKIEHRVCKIMRSSRFL